MFAFFIRYDIDEALLGTAPCTRQLYGEEVFFKFV
jgi:hypothetical protein